MVTKIIFYVLITFFMIYIFGQIYSGKSLYTNNQLNYLGYIVIFVLLLLGLFIYYERLLPDTFWEIPHPQNKDDFEFGKLDRLINQYKTNNGNKTIRDEIQHEINTIYFSFPNHLHPKIDQYLYQNYGFTKT